MRKQQDERITIRSLLLGALFSAVFAVLTVYLSNRRGMLVTANQIPVLPYALLILMVVLINPICRFLRVIKGFTRTEVLIVFIMGMVSSGISTFGLTAQVVPVIGSLFNRHWNNEQSQWNRYVEPFVEDDFFLATEGIRRAARAYLAELRTYEDLRAVYEAAVGMEGGAEPDADGPVAKMDGKSRVEIIQTYPARLEAQAEVVEERRRALRDLEVEAFEKAELFRSGLPRGKRAFPGVLPIAGQDDLDTYLGRLQRLMRGKKAAGHLHATVDLLDAPDALRDSAVREEASGRLQTAADLLRSEERVETLDERLAELEAEENRLTGEIVEMDARLVELNREKRTASVRRAEDLADEVEALRKKREDVGETRKDVAHEGERVLRRRDALARMTEAAASVVTVRDRLLEGAASPAELRGDLNTVLAQFPSFDASLRRYFLGDVPWGQWVGPLFNWAVVIGLTYLILMTFNVLIFRQWAYNEKLIYPLAELPEILAGTDEDAGRVWPSLFSSGLFWTGFMVSACVLGWNLLSAAGILANVQPIDLVNSWQEFIVNTPLAGLVGTRSSIFFTMIGVAFLIPKKVSFSLWFFWVLYMLQLLVLVGLGYGQDERSFPAFWWYTLNFRTAQGGGALLVFASVVLFKCRRFLLCAFSPSSVAHLAPDEQRELRISSMLFIMGTVGMILFMWLRMGANVYYTILAYAIIMVITIGLVRAVAEGGILGFQAWVSPFHFIRHTVGFDKSWTAPSFVAPLMVYYSIMFLDIKTFIAPAMANSLKIRDDLKMKRGRFHLAIALCIFLAAAASIAAAIMMSYSSGADSMHGWFYTAFPRGLFSRLADMAKTPPTATASGRMWLGSGALLMALLLFFRQRFFWLPHPIGLIMLVNPIMRTYWFSIMLGWIAKTLVTKYGNKNTYQRMRGMFVGLIVGELTIVVIALVVSIVIRRYLYIDLNR